MSVVTPGRVKDLKSWSRVLTGLPSRLGAVEFVVPSDAVRNPGGIKLFFSYFQQVLDASDSELALQLATHELQPIHFADKIEAVNRLPNILGKSTSQMREMLDRVMHLDLTAVIESSLPIETVGKALRAVGHEFRICIIELNGSTIAAIPRIQLSADLERQLRQHFHPTTSSPIAEKQAIPNQYRLNHSSSNTRLPSAIALEDLIAMIGILLAFLVLAGAFWWLSQKRLKQNQTLQAVAAFSPSDTEHCSNKEISVDVDTDLNHGPSQSNLLKEASLESGLVEELIKLSHLRSTGDLSAEEFKLAKQRSDLGDS